MAPKNLNTRMFKNLISNILNGSSPRIATGKYWENQIYLFLPVYEDKNKLTVSTYVKP